MTTTMKKSLSILLVVFTLFGLLSALAITGRNTSDSGTAILASEDKSTALHSSTQSGSWQWPVSSRSTSQSFGHYSSAMAKKGRPYHCGVDLVSSKHTIYAASNGTIVYRGYTSGNGNHVIIKHSSGGKTFYTLYSHLSNFDGCPKVNKSVSKGQKIGTMGNTGNSTGTHLHFAVFTGYSSDPYGYAANSQKTCLLMRTTVQSAGTMNTRDLEPCPSLWGSTCKPEKPFLWSAKHITARITSHS